MTILRILVLMLFAVANPALGQQMLGCFTDQGTRDLSGFHSQPPNLTNEMCRQTCASKGFAFSATQYGNNCFCGNSYGKYGALAMDKCWTACTGNANEKCGGPWANLVTRTGVGTLATPAPAPTARNPPNAPALMSPTNTRGTNWQPPIAATAIYLEWVAGGNANNQYPTTHWLDFWRWNSSTKSWEATVTGYVGGGPQPMGTRMRHPMQLARGTCYIWRVFGVNPQRDTNPWFTPSNWHGFCTA